MGPHMAYAVRLANRDNARPDWSTFVMGRTTPIRILTYALAAMLQTYALAAHAHWPDQAAHQIAELGTMEVERGGTIERLRMSYVTHGTLNPNKDNAILLLHGGGANHHVFDHLIGPGKPFDTEEYFVIATDSMGNTQTGFEHSTSATNSGLKMQFPPYNTRDMVNAEYRLVTQAFGIERLALIAGISMGANKAMQFAVSHPNFMDAILPISGGALTGTQRFFRGRLMHSIIETCAGWDGGQYDDNPKECAANALSVLVPYFYTREWWEQNVDTPAAYQRWRIGWGDYYLDVQDARDLHYMIRAGGLGWLGDTPGFNGDVIAALGSIKASVLFVYSPQDQFFTPLHVDTQVKAIRGARSVAIESSAGHLICCNGDPQATQILGEAIRAFLQERRTRRYSAN